MARKIVRELLAPRQKQVIALIMEGYADKEIALKLGVSYHTVKGHILHIYEKLGAVDRAHAVAIYLGHAQPRRMR